MTSPKTSPIFELISYTYTKIKVSASVEASLNKPNEINAINKLLEYADRSFYQVKGNDKNNNLIDSNEVQSNTKNEYFYS